MKILIGADIVPTNSNSHEFERADVDKLVDPKLQEVLNQADFRIFNLEVPLTDQKSPISKCGPALIASTKSANGIRALGADFLTLANNHILDQGEQGLFSTMKTLEKQGIAYAGVGVNITEAQKPFILERDGKKIGIYCCAEHEFSIADDHKAGANPFDPLESLDHIAALRLKCDYVIVLYHGGKEQYRYPSPYLQKVCRKITEKGADLVICQHTHCVGCEEKYSKGTIVYGQGNFLFDDCNNEFWNSSLLIAVEISNKISVNYIPLEKKAKGVALSSNPEILDNFKARSEEIKNNGFISAQYQKIADSEFSRYLGMAQGKRYTSLFFRVLNKLTLHRLKRFMLERQYRTEDYAAFMNLVACEVHREGLLTIMNDKLSDKSDQ